MKGQLIVILLSALIQVSRSLDAESVLYENLEKKMFRKLWLSSDVDKQMDTLVGLVENNRDISAGIKAKVLDDLRFLKASQGDELCSYETYERLSRLAHMVPVKKTLIERDNKKKILPKIFHYYMKKHAETCLPKLISKYQDIELKLENHINLLGDIADKFFSIVNENCRDGLRSLTRCGMETSPIFLHNEEAVVRAIGEVTSSRGDKASNCIYEKFPTGCNEKLRYLHRQFSEEPYDQMSGFFFNLYEQFSFDLNLDSDLLSDHPKLLRALYIYRMLIAMFSKYETFERAVKEYRKNNVL